MMVQKLNAVWSNESYCCNGEDDSVQLQHQFSSGPGPAYRHRIRDRIFLALHNISRDFTRLVT